MSQMTRFVPTGGILMALCAAFAGCAARTDVSATGSTPAQFTHVFITAQSVWFNKNASATADDSGWSKFDLKTPVTIDLVQQSNGTLGEIANDLRVAPGTYNSILLLPVDSTTPLTTAAQALGATYNQEADIATGSTTSPPIPLTIPHPEKGIVIAGSVKVPIGKVSTTGIGTPTNTGTTNSATGLFGQPTTVNPTSTTTTSTTTNNTVTASFAGNFEGNRDLHLFTFPIGSSTPQTGVLLSASAAASDLSTSGGITGTLSLTTITNTGASVANTSSGRTAIWASAELPSSDNPPSHHVIVASAPVASDGTFTIYPLPSNSTNPTVYDVVIHGPNIETIIIKSVSVATTTPNFQFGANTTGAVNTTTATGAVSLGTITPNSTPCYQVSLNSTATNATTLPGGAALTFYQTLPGSGEIPYAIDEVGIDPVNSALATPEELSTNVGTTGSGIATGTFSSNGTTISPLPSLSPQEGLGVYTVGVTAPLYADSVPSTTIKVSPTSAASCSTGTTTTTTTTAPTPVQITAVPSPLTPANGASTGTISVSVTNNNPGEFNQGTLLVSLNGAVIGSIDLTGAFKNSGGSNTVMIPNLPSGNVYYLSAIVWSSSQPSQTPVTYESSTAPVTLSGSQATGAITIQ